MRGSARLPAAVGTVHTGLLILYALGPGRSTQTAIATGKTLEGLAETGPAFMRIASQSITDVGRVRQGNEDACVCSDELGLYVVADGMGGHAAGEIASETAISVIADYVKRALVENDVRSPDDTDPGIEPTIDIFVEGVKEANRRIAALSENNPSYAGMGTTVSGMLFHANQAAIAHVGDSRVYRLRNGAFDLLTEDHSWVNEQVRHNIITPEEAKNHRWRNVITRALGNKPEVEVDTFVVGVETGDVYLLCSDGLTGMVEDETVQYVLSHSGADLAHTASRLVEMANEAGGTDNITLILLRIDD